MSARGDADELLAFAERVLKVASRDADAAEVVLSANEALGTTARGGHDAGKSTSRVRFGVRVLKGRRVGFGSAGGVDDAAVDAAVKRAWLTLDAMADAAPGESAPSFPTGTRGRAAAFDAGMPFTPEQVTSVAADASEALEAEKRVSYAAAVAAGSYTRYVTMNSAGASVADATTTFVTTLDARVTHARQRSLLDSRFGVAPPDVDAFVHGFLDDARALSDEIAFQPSRVDVVFDAATAACFNPTLLLQLKGRLVDDASSVFTRRDDEAVPRVTIRDESAATASGRARAFDDEGLACEPLTFVRDGVLEVALRTSAEAEAAGVDAPGRGFRHRGHVKEAPFSAPVNLAIAPGRESVEDVIGTRERVVLVRRNLVGWYHSTSLTGRFSLVAPAAFLYEHGKLKGVLPKATLGGNLFDALAHADFRVCREQASAQQGTGTAMLLPDLAVAV